MQFWKQKSTSTWNISFHYDLNFFTWVSLSEKYKDLIFDWIRCLYNWIGSITVPVSGVKMSSDFPIMTSIRHHSSSLGIIFGIFGIIFGIFWMMFWLVGVIFSNNDQHTPPHSSSWNSILNIWNHIWNIMNWRMFWIVGIIFSNNDQHTPPHSSLGMIFGIFKIVSGKFEIFGTIFSNNDKHTAYSF